MPNNDASARIPELEAAIADEDETIKVVEAMALGKQKLDPRFPDTGAALQELRDMEVRKNLLRDQLRERLEIQEQLARSEARRKGPVCTENQIRQY
jgi:hypothetical protein